MKLNLYIFDGASTAFKSKQSMQDTPNNNKNTN